MQAVELYLETYYRLCRALWEGGGGKLEQFIVDNDTIALDNNDQITHRLPKPGDWIYLLGTVLGSIKAQRVTKMLEGFF